MMYVAVHQSETHLISISASVAAAAAAAAAAAGDDDDDDIVDGPRPVSATDVLLLFSPVEVIRSRLFDEVRPPIGRHQLIPGDIRRTWLASRVM